MADVALAPIWQDAEGVAWIGTTHTKVIEVMLDQEAHGWSAEEIHRQHSHLSLEQVRAALEYYEAHRQALDEEIERRYRSVQALRAEAPGQLTRAELEARRSLRDERLPA